MQNQLSNAQAIMRYFGIPLQEMKAELAALGDDEKAELGQLCRMALDEAERLPSD